MNSSPCMSLNTTLSCSFGMTPCQLTVLPIKRVFVCKMPAATIMDQIPFLNISSFGMCSSPMNPAVIAATAAALGVFTPAPCIPATAAPFIPTTPTVFISKIPICSSTSKVFCTWGGVISAVAPAQFTVKV